MQGPFFNDDFGDTFGVIYALSAEGYSQSELSDLARGVRARLLRVRDVGKVEIFGLQDEHVFLELSRSALARYGLTAAAVSQQITEQNAVVSAGRMEADDWQIRCNFARNLSLWSQFAPCQYGRGLSCCGWVTSQRFAAASKTLPGPH